MKSLDNIKNGSTDRILASKNERLLVALNNIIDSIQTEDVILLSSQQTEMLSMSENDIANGEFISESELKKSDSKWLS